MKNISCEDKSLVEIRKYDESLNAVQIKIVDNTYNCDINQDFKLQDFDRLQDFDDLINNYPCYENGTDDFKKDEVIHSEELRIVNQNQVKPHESNLIKLITFQTERVKSIQTTCLLNFDFSKLHQLIKSLKSDHSKFNQLIKPKESDRFKQNVLLTSFYVSINDNDFINFSAFNQQNVIYVKLNYLGQNWNNDTPSNMSSGAVILPNITCFGKSYSMKKAAMKREYLIKRPLHFKKEVIPEFSSFGDGEGFLGTKECFKKYKMNRDVIEICRNCSSPIRNRFLERSFYIEASDIDEQLKPEYRELIKKYQRNRNYVLNEGQAKLNLLHVLVWIVTFILTLNMYLFAISYAFEIDPLYSIILNFVGVKKVEPPPPPTLLETIINFITYIL